MAAPEAGSLRSGGSSCFGFGCLVCVSWLKADKQFWGWNYKHSGVWTRSKSTGVSTR